MVTRKKLVNGYGSINISSSLPTFVTALPLIFEKFYYLNVSHFPNKNRPYISIVEWLKHRIQITDYAFGRVNDVFNYNCKNQNLRI